MQGGGAVLPSTNVLNGSCPCGGEGGGGMGGGRKGERCCCEGKRQGAFRALGHGKEQRWHVAGEGQGRVHPPESFTVQFGSYICTQQR